MELHDSLFPGLVKSVEFDTFCSYELFMENVVLYVLLLVLQLVVVDPLLDDLVDFRLEVESDEDQIVPHVFQISA